MRSETTEIRRSRKAAAQPDYVELAVRYLARVDRTVAQVERFMQEKGASSTQVRSVVHELERLGYLNDQAYATRWAENRLTRRPMGRERLKAELLQRGFKEQVTERALRNAYRSMSEHELACQALEGHIRRTRPGQWVRFLRQRGFDDDTIQQVTQVNMDTGLEQS